MMNIWAEPDNLGAIGKNDGMVEHLIPPILINQLLISGSKFDITGMYQLYQI
jgi:hypothetical protein